MRQLLLALFVLSLPCMLKLYGSVDCQLDLLDDRYQEACERLRP